MTYPNQPQQPQQPYPPAPPPPQAPAPQGYYPPAPPQAPYPPQQQGYYPPPQVPQAQPLPQPTVADFLNQPKSGEGPTLSDFLKNINQSITGIVSRAIDKGDMRVSMDMNNPTQPARRKDGNLKYYMQVPLQVNSAFFPEGRARWIVQGQAQGELSRAMSAAGCPPDIQVPEYGAEITITKVGERPIKNMSPQAIFQVIYRRPPGAAQGQQIATATYPPQAPPDGQLPGQPPQPQGQVTPQPYAPPVQPQVPQYQAPPPVQPQAPQQPAPGAPLSVPPQPAPPGTNPYGNPALPPNQPVPPQAPQQYAATAGGITPTPEQEALLARVASQAPPQPPQAPQQPQG